MSFQTWMAIGIIFFLVFVVSDWLTDKTILFIKKRVAKRREKELGSDPVRYVGQFGKGQTVTKLEEIFPAEELFKED